MFTLFPLYLLFSIQKTAEDTYITFFEQLTLAGFYYILTWLDLRAQGVSQGCQ